MVRSSLLSSFNRTGLVLSVIEYILYIYIYIYINIGRLFGLVYVKAECDGLNSLSLGGLLGPNQKFSYSSDLTIVNKNTDVSFE